MSNKIIESPIVCSGPALTSVTLWKGGFTFIDFTIGKHYFVLHLHMGVACPNKLGLGLSSTPLKLVKLG